MIASSVWAVMRMSLQIATGFLTYFDKVSDVFMRIGKSSVIQQDVVTLFPNCQELQEFMCEYLILVVNFCKEVVSFATKSFLSQLKSSLGASFDPECKTFETAISVWSGLIDQKVQFLTAESQIFSKNAITKTNMALGLLTSSAAKTRAFEERRIQFLHQLSPHQGQFDANWRRQRKKGSATWILSEEKYQNWKKGLINSVGVYWITGNIGSGKTVLLANVVADLASPDPTSTQTPLVASFFCQYDSPKTLRASCVMRSFAYQFVKALDENAASKLMAKLSASEEDAMAMASVLKKHLPKERSYFLVIDAIDDCLPEEQVDILRGVRHLSMQLQEFSLRVEPFLESRDECLYSRFVPLPQYLFPSRARTDSSCSSVRYSPSNLLFQQGGN